MFWKDSILAVHVADQIKFDPVESWNWSLRFVGEWDPTLTGLAGSLSPFHIGAWKFSEHFEESGRYLHHAMGKAC